MPKYSSLQARRKKKHKEFRGVNKKKSNPQKQPKTAKKIKFKLKVPSVMKKTNLHALDCSVLFCSERLIPLIILPYLNAILKP